MLSVCIKSDICALAVLNNVDFLRFNQKPFVHLTVTSSAYKLNVYLLAGRFLDTTPDTESRHKYFWTFGHHRYNDVTCLHLLMCLCLRCISFQSVIVQIVGIGHRHCWSIS